MKFQVASDLHLEFHNPLPALAEGAGVIVCAGDFAPIGTGAVRYAAEQWAEARHILYVPGIHGHMHNTVDVTVGETRVLANPAGYSSTENPDYDPALCIEL